MSYIRGSGDGTQRSAQHTLTLDDSAIASHPGRLRVSSWLWTRRYPKWPVLLAVALVATVVLSFTVDRMFLASVPLALIPNVFYWKRVREHFRHGDANPGVVVSRDPLRIAVWTDMTKGEGSYPVLRVFGEPPWEVEGKPLDVGTRVATVGLYAVDEEEARPYWERFDPRPVAPVAAEEAEAQALLESFGPERWERLERAVTTMGAVEEGLHRLELEGSSWGRLQSVG